MPVRASPVPAHKFLCRGRAAHAREAERGARAWRGPAEVGGARGSALLEVPAGGLPPAVGGEGGCPHLPILGGVLFYVTASDGTLGLVSGAAGAASFFFEWPQVWGAGGAAAAAKAEGGCLSLPSGPGRARFYVNQRMSVARVRLGRGRCCVDFFSETTGLEGGRGGGRRDAGAGGGRAGGRGGWARRRARRRCGGRRAAGVVGERGVGWGCRGGERVGAGVGVVV